MFKEYNEQEDKENTKFYLSKLKTAYIVKYSTGSHDDHYVGTMFVTFDKNVAENYVKKFSRMVENCKDFYRTFEEHDYSELISDEDYVDSKNRYSLIEKYNIYWNRWNQLDEFNRCYFEEIEIR